MLTLQFELEYQKINLVNRWETVATDSKNYLVASFSTISDDWTTPITAIFTNDKDEQPYAVVVGADSTLESNECYVPWEVLKDESNVYVSAYCGNLHTTVTAQFHVYKSGYADGETPPPPSPTVYDAIMQAITDLQNGKQDKLTAGTNITITEENVISASSGSNDYTDLTNKPSINNVTLSGNKTSDDLSLQSKLTAGNNITIDEDNVISAEGGGVTSYENLTDKPSINDISLEGNKSASDLGLQSLIYNYFTVENNEYLSYDFNRLISLSSNSVLYCIPFTRITNFPSSLSDKVRQSGALYIFHYVHTVAGAKYLIRRIMGRSPSGNYAEFAQYCTVTDSSGSVIPQSDWAELTGGGTQIASGVVNANGTSTFTDSDGSTFTTTGASVIGPQGDDYVLTAQDKSDIADIVLGELPNADTMSF